MIGESWFRKKETGLENPDPAKTTPTFEDLKAALPQESQDEFQRIGEELKNLGGGMDGREIEVEGLSPEKKAKLDRYNELTDLAKKKIEARQ